MLINKQCIIWRKWNTFAQSSDCFCVSPLTNSPWATWCSCLSCDVQSGSQLAKRWTSLLRETPRCSVRALLRRPRRAAAWHTWFHHLWGRRTHMSECRPWAEIASLHLEPAKAMPSGRQKIETVHPRRLPPLLLPAIRQERCSCTFYDKFLVKRRSSWQTSAGWKTLGCCGCWPSWLWTRPCQWWSTRSRIEPSECAAEWACSGSAGRTACRGPGPAARGRWVLEPLTWSAVRALFVTNRKKKRDLLNFTWELACFSIRWHEYRKSYLIKSPRHERSQEMLHYFPVCLTLQRPLEDLT